MDAITSKVGAGYVVEGAELDLLWLGSGGGGGAEGALALGDADEDEEAADD